MCTVKRFCTHQLFEQIECLIVHDGYMIGVPTHRTAHMEHQFRNKKEKRRNQIADILCLLIMPCIEGVHQFSRSTIAGNKVMRSDCVTFQTDTKKFCFQTVLHTVKFFSQYLIQALGHNLTITHPLNSQVLAAVMYPNIHDTRVALRLTHSIGYLTATLSMFNPKISDTLVGIGQ